MFPSVPSLPSPQHTRLHFKPPGLVSPEVHHLAGYHQVPPHQQHQHIAVSPSAAQMMMSHSVAQVRPRPSC